MIMAQKTSYNTLNGSHSSGDNSKALRGNYAGIGMSYDDDNDIAIIMEDDICIDVLDKSGGDIERVVLQAPSDWEIIQLHYSNPEQIKHLVNDRNIFIKWKTSLYSTGCYIINNKGMEKIIKTSIHGNNIRLNQDSKMAVADDYIYRQCITYTYTIPLFAHTAEDSHIQAGSHVAIRHKLSKDLILNYLGLDENDVCKKN